MLGNTVTKQQRHWEDQDGVSARKLKMEIAKRAKEHVPLLCKHISAQMQVVAGHSVVVVVAVRFVGRFCSDGV